MTTAATPLALVLETLKQLRPEELTVVENDIASAKAQRLSPSKSLLNDRRFMIPFEDYLRLSEEECDDVQELAYEEHRDWLYAELDKRRAKWILICAGQIVDSSTTLQTYPTEERMEQLGRQLGFAPLVFIANPIIEESSWTALPESDFYPGMPIIVGAASWKLNDMVQSGLQINADFDTGSGNTMLDYDGLRSVNIIPSQRFKRHQSAYHLGRMYSCYFLPVQIATVDEDGGITAKVVSALCVRDWQRSPLCLVNPFRRALAGRNVLLELSLRVELNGRNRITKILGEA